MTIFFSRFIGYITNVPTSWVVAATHTGCSNIDIFRLTSSMDGSCGAVKSGKAKAGVVKNWWWDANKGKFSELEMYRIPVISIEKNPDNILTASKAVPADVQKKIADAAIAVKDIFGAPEMVPFDASRLEFPLSLMEKGEIDPMTYSW